jgi:hypothetical protein
MMYEYRPALHAALHDALHAFRSNCAQLVEATYPG